jgi:hypothetical protein
MGEGVLEAAPVLAGVPALVRATRETLETLKI